MNNAIDHFTGARRIRPDLNAKMTYDFDFRQGKTRKWRYISSANQLSDFGKLKLSVLQHNGHYRIIRALTGEIVEENTNDLKRCSDAQDNAITDNGIDI